jgi:hypothetical protein
LRDCPERQREVGANRLIDAELDTGLGDLLEPRLLYADVVQADTSKFERIIALFVRRCSSGIAGACLDRGDLGVLNGCAGRIENISDE